VTIPSKWQRMTQESSSGAMSKNVIDTFNLTSLCPQAKSCVIDVCTWDKQVSSDFILLLQLEHMKLIPFYVCSFLTPSHPELSLTA
jgi:hypothetical protein